VNFRFLLLFILVPFVASTQCPTSNVISFYEQADLDSFLVNYPNCTEFEGSISINICIELVNNDQFGEFSIYDLSPLSNLTSLGGISIHGIQGCWYNLPMLKELRNLNGLQNLTELGSFSLGSGIPIYSLGELSQVTELEYLSLRYTNLSSVDIDVTITNSLEIEFNENLDDISRINLAENIEELDLYFNDRLNDAPSLNGVKRIDKLRLG